MCEAEKDLSDVWDVRDKETVVHEPEPVFLPDRVQARACSLELFCERVRIVPFADFFEEGVLQLKVRVYLFLKGCSDDGSGCGESRFGEPG